MQGVINYNELVKGKDRHYITGMFYQLQLLKSCGIISLDQEDDGDIIITAGPLFIEEEEETSEQQEESENVEFDTGGDGGFNNEDDPMDEDAEIAAGLQAEMTDEDGTNCLHVSLCTFPSHSL